MKISIIGAGSIGFTQRLFADIMKVPELQNAHVSLCDINQRNLDSTEELLRCFRDHNNLSNKISATLDQVESVKDADYIICCVRIGGLPAFETDINIPLKYGVDQCVGDTLCAGGIMYGQRCIAFFDTLCDNILEHAKENALLINFSNPMAINTWACLDKGVNTIGLCHGVQHGAEQIKEVLKVGDKQTFDYLCSGINHQTWYTDILVDGKKVDAETLCKAFEAHEEYKDTEKVRIDMLRRFDYYSTESNGHLSEYLPWYRKYPEDIDQWIDMRDWIHGETGGYLRVCSESRNWFEQDFHLFLDDAKKKLSEMDRSEEHASFIIESLETGRIYKGHFNVRNDGAITNLADDCIIESPGFVDRNGLHMKSNITLDDGCAAVCNRAIDVQRLAVKAAQTGNIQKLRQAFLMDPLVGSVCDPMEIWQMVDEMLVAQAEWLPQYAHEIPLAKKRLEDNPPQYKRPIENKLRKVRTVEELRAQETRSGAAGKVVQ